MWLLKGGAVLPSEVLQGLIIDTSFIFLISSMQKRKQFNMKENLQKDLVKLFQTHYNS